MDAVDKAQEIELAQRLAALEAAAEAARGVLPAQDKTPADSADECIECGNLIPSARQVAMPGCQLCVECAERFEYETRMRRLR